MKSLVALLPALLILVSCSLGCNKKEPSANHSMTINTARVLEQREAAGQLKNDGEPEAKPGKPDDAKSATLARRIKYSATIQLITDDFARSEAEVKKLVKEAHGYVANSEVKIEPGSIKAGFWKVRIPVKEFESFRDAILTLGEVEKNATDSQDLTEEYYDLENNIKNRQAEEDALRKLMEKAADKMDSFFAVRHELNQVHEDIDRQLGRLKLLANLTDMTTVSLSIREKEKYIADKRPAPIEIPAFATRLSKSLGDSTATLVGLIQSLAIVLAALLPWSPFFLTAGVSTWILAKRNRRAAIEGMKTEPPVQQDLQRQ